MLQRLSLFFFGLIFSIDAYGQGLEVKSINTLSATDNQRDAFIVDLEADGDFQVDHIYISLTGEMKHKWKKDGYIFLIKSINEEFEIHNIF